MAYILMISENLALKLLKSFSKAHTRIVIVYLIIIGLIIPVEIYQFPNQIANLLAQLRNDAPINTRVFLPITLSLVFIILLSVSKRFCENDIIPKFATFTREWIFKYIIDENKRKNKELPLGKLMSILSELPYSARSAIIVFVRSILPYLVGFVFLTFYFFTLNTYIGILQLVTFLMWTALHLWRGRQCARSFDDAQEDILDLYENVQDKISNLRSIYSAQTETTEIKQHNRYEKQNQVKYQRSLNCVLKTEVISNSIVLTSFCIFNALIIYLFKNKKIDLKTVTSMYIVEIYYWINILRRLESNVGEFIHAIGNVQCIEKIVASLGTHYQSHDEAASNSHTAQPIQGSAIVQLKNATFKYPGSTTTILQKLNLNINKNEIVWLKGHSGSGKTTLFKIMLGYIPLTEGKAFVCGRNVKTSDINEIRKMIAYVNQDTRLFNSTVYDNISYGIDDISKKKVKLLLEHLNIRAFAKLSNGIETNVGVLGTNISGGQRQVILLLRAYLKKNTKLVLLDEPISGVDADSVPEILKLIRIMGHTRTILVISHNAAVQSITHREVYL